jgi:hypothetical protein
MHAWAGTRPKTQLTTGRNEERRGAGAQAIRARARNGNMALLLAVYLRPSGQRRCLPFSLAVPLR